MNYRLYIIYYRVSLEKEYRMMYRIGICDDEEACRIKNIGKYKKYSFKK